MPLSISQRRRAGFTLVELSIVLGIIGLITGAIWWAASNAQELRKDNDAVTELQTISQNMQTLMAGRSFPGTGASSILPSMITAQVVPSTYVNASNATEADTPWSPNTFGIWAPTNSNSKNYRLSFYNVTWQGCLTLLMEGTACQTGQAECPIDVLTDGGSQGEVSASVGTPWSQVMTSTEAASLCGNNSYSGGFNSVEFDYSL